MKPEYNSILNTVASNHKIVNFNKTYIRMFSDMRVLLTYNNENTIEDLTVEDINAIIELSVLSLDNALAVAKSLDLVFDFTEITTQVILVENTIPISLFNSTLPKIVEAKVSSVLKVINNILHILVKLDLLDIVMKDLEQV